MAVGHYRAQGFLGDSIGQDNVVCRVAEGGAQGGQLRVVVGEGVALAGVVSRHYRVGILEGGHGQVQAVLVGEVLQIQFSGGTEGYADGSPGQLQGVGNPGVLANHKALAVVEHGLGVVAPAGVPGRGPGNRPHQHIHFAGLNRRPALGSGNQADFDGVGVAQHGGGQSPAQVNVETDVVAGGVQPAIAGHVVAAGADDPAPFLDGGEAAAFHARQGAGGQHSHSLFYLGLHGFIFGLHSFVFGLQVSIFGFQGRGVGLAGDHGQGQRGQSHKQ